MKIFSNELSKRIDNLGEGVNYLLRDTEEILERLTKIEQFVSQLSISEDVEEDTREARVITQLDGSEITEPTDTIDSVSRFASVDDIDARIKASAKLDFRHDG